MLKVGKGYDLFRMSLYEAAALGANMSVPYGAWMGSVIQDSFNPPHELCVEIQRFLADHEHLYSSKTYSEIAVVYSVETEFQRESGRGIFADNRYNQETSEIGPFWQACEALSDAVQPYDVLFFPDGDLRPDSLTPENLNQYKTLILPDCRYLTQAQAQLLREYLNKGGTLLVMGELGRNLPLNEQESILKHRGTHRITNSSGFRLSWLPVEPQLRLLAPANLAINLQRVEGEIAIHIIRYDYDFEKDTVPGLDELILELSLPGSFSGMEIFAPNSSPKGTIETIAHGLHVLNLQDLPLYSIVLLKSISDNTN
jgi:hypothetical protein